jgi:pimeloyl-ACP methyl ester carboxylesterase
MNFSVRGFAMLAAVFWCLPLAFADDVPSLHQMKKQKKQELITVIIESKKSCNLKFAERTEQKTCLRSEVKTYFKTMIKNTRTAKKVCADHRGDAQAFKSCYLEEYFTNFAYTPTPESLDAKSEILNADSEFFEVDCPFEIPGNVSNIRCGTVPVPENHDDPKGAQINVAVAVLKSRTESSNKSPLYYINGGPGAISLNDDTLSYWADTSLFDERDLILFDMRGVGSSVPNYACKKQLDELFEMNEDEAEDVEFVDYLQKCYDAGESNGYNIRYYNSTQAAHDIDAIRIALGHEQVSLYGISYGTRLALTYAMHYSEHLHGLILDGVLTDTADIIKEDPLFFQNKLNSIFENCLTDKACNESYPDLKKVFYDVLSGLKENPVQISVVNPKTEELEEFSLDDYSFLGFTDMLVRYDAEKSVVPMAIHKAYRGDFESYENLAGFSVDMLDYIAVGTHHAVMCNDSDYSEIDEREILKDLDKRLLPYYIGESFQKSFCSDWPYQDQRLVFPKVITMIPTLIFSGENDSITPAKYGDIVKKKLPKSQHVVLSMGGHGASSDYQCSLAMIDAYLDKPTARVKNLCDDEVVEPDFMVDQTESSMASSKSAKENDAYCYRDMTATLGGDVLFFYPLDEKTGKRTACYHVGDIIEDGELEKQEISYIRHNKYETDSYYEAASFYSVFDKEEYTKSVTFYDLYGEVSPNENGVAWVGYRYYSDGLIKENYDENDELVADNQGVKRYFMTYNDDYYVTSSKRLDDEGEYMTDKNGVYEKRYDYDQYGYRKRVSFYDAEGRLSENNYGIAIVEYKNDVADTNLETRYFDKNHVLTENKDGIAMYKRTVDKNGNVTSLSYYDTATQPLEKSGGFAKIVWSYDKWGNEVKEELFDKNGNTTEDKDSKIAIVKRKYDSIGAEIEQAYYGKNDELKIDQELQMARIVWRYDDEGAWLSTVYYDQFGELTEDEDGIARINKVLDEVKYYDATGKEIQPDFDE